MIRLLGLSGLLRLLLAELGNLNLDGLVDTPLQLRAVAYHEQQFEPDEQGSQEDRLEEVVKQCRGPPLKLAVADKLRDPGDNIYRDGNLVRADGVLQPEVVGPSGGSEADEC